MAVDQRLGLTAIGARIGCRPRRRTLTPQGGGRSPTLHCTYGLLGMNLRLPSTEESLSIILKLVGDACNINCHYCYEKRKPEHENQWITPELLQSFFEKAGGRPLALELHGGEPLLIGRDRMRSLLRVCRGYAGPLRITLQTNATLLDDNWLGLFQMEWPELEYSTSLDGDREGNRHRVDYADRPIGERVEQTLRRFERLGLRLGVICTVTRSLLLRPRETLNYFLQFPALNIVKINPCFDYNVTTRYSPGNALSLSLYNPSGEGLPGWGIRPHEFRMFLTEVFDEWCDSRLYTRLLVEPFMSVLRVLQGQSATFCVYDGRKCAHILTLYPDGRLGSCDELDLPDAQLAPSIHDLTSLDDVLHFQTNPKLGEDLNTILAKCESCDYRATCNGGCLATRKRYFGSSYYEEYCRYRIELIEHVKKRLREGRAK